MVLKMTRIRNLRICNLYQVPFFINTSVIFKVENIMANNGPCRFVNNTLDINGKYSKIIIVLKNNTKKINKINDYIKKFELRRVKYRNF